MERSARSTSWKKNAKPAAALVALGGFLPLSLWLGDELWNLAAYWPASGIGFGATVGVLLPITFTAAERSFRRVSSDGSKYSPRWVVAGIVYAAVALVSALAASRVIPGKGSSGPCHSEWQPCWVNHVYPGAFLTTLGSLAATVAVMHWLPSWTSKLRARSRR
ncbi:hypothetical protein [Streptomyces ureilyticus]|uniref:Uncharacterized protein n=1 Tax=Streptomyces ureilyticus TaxID=1775131 RepID=A0ABX0DTM3_9ACTN|nr:hypothetical protein [Streptomyces ureilyticus]NGO45250.1 hypothetical protein [Streptomyces ureilyticus]